MTRPSAIANVTDAGFDARRVRDDFPALHQDVHGKPLVYLDSAATTLKPRVVIDAVADVYARDCANIHRAVHLLSQRATARFEEAREKVRAFLNANDTNEVIFTRGTTESVNLVAQSWARTFLREGDEVLITELEHHSNIVPWQIVCQQVGAELVVVPMTDRGEITREAFEEQLSSRTRLVAMAHVSNALGTVLPVEELTGLAHERGAVVLLDGAQAVSHVPVDVQALDCDFYTFSGHKLYGPTGVGVLYGRERLLEGMPPYQGGGDMIRSVTFAETIYNDLPYKFEAGTPNIAGAIGLGAAIDYLKSFDQEAVHAHENAVLRYATKALGSVAGLRLIGTAPGKVASASFLMDAVHPHDIGTIVDSEGVAIRTGHHCAQPVMEHFGVAATARASLGLYNTTEDVDALIRALHKVKELFG
ncbi:MAG: cysteine desulfurase [Myxococcales bacterium]|nr:cysteine desulfurase [Myxococcales bacterium]MDH3485752.1 cysteine desulfurase [Myxococcales bacterium]